MKKYVKPELFYEHFELAQHIANCYWELNSASETSCVAEAEDQGQGFTLFMTAKGCEAGPDNKSYEQYCLHTGTEGGAPVFIS